MKYLFYATLSYSFSVLRPIEIAIKKTGGSVAWFIPDGSEAEAFIKDSDIRLLTIEDVMSYAPVATLVPGNVVPDFFPGIKVQVFHGFDSGKKNKFNIRGFFDLYCTQGPNITDGFNNISDGTCEIVETGWSKLDPLFTTHLDVPTYKTEEPLILYAPTFSPKLTSTFELFSQIESLSTKRKWKWLVKLHPKATKEEISMFKSLESNNLKFIETGDIIPLLQAADILLSDTSSILTEFSLLNKVSISFRNRRPEPWMINFSKANLLEENIEKALSEDSEQLNNISKHIKLVHPYNDGRSSERVLSAIDTLVKRGIDHLKPKPLNLLRRLKMRKKLKYYRF